MGMPENDKKEALGQAYVRAVVAKAGYNIARSDKDFGLDGTIKDIQVRNNRFYETGFGIEYQLKSSSNVYFEDDQIVYDLESNNYNDLATWSGTNPGILMLLVLPNDENEWLDFTKDRLKIRRCAWWCSLEGSLPTDNIATKRIRIPQGQVFSPESLEAMMHTVRGGSRL